MVYGTAPICICGCLAVRAVLHSSHEDRSLHRICHTADRPDEVDAFLDPEINYVDEETSMCYARARVGNSMLTVITVPDSAYQNAIKEVILNACLRLRTTNRT